MANKLNASKMLDELVADSLGCLRYIKKNEDLNISMIKKDDVGLKRVKVASDSGLELMEEELKSQEEELKKMDVNGLVEKFEKMNVNGSKTYVIRNTSDHEISNEVVLRYIGSMIYDNLIDLDSRDGNKVDTGYPLKYFGEIVKYMKNEYDIKKLNGVEFDEFCRELISLNIPLRSDITKRFFSQFSEYGDRWKNCCLIVNEKKYKLMVNYMKLKLGDLQYNSERDRYEIIRNTTIPSANEILTDFENYLKAPSKYVKNEELKICNIMKLFSEIGIDTSNEIVKQYLLNYTSFYCFGSNILVNKEYDDKLREWNGDYNWKLIYRASEHEYTASSFHECCNDKGPTLIVIKSSGGWIFGGYTTQSWSGDGIYNKYDIFNNQ